MSKHQLSRGINLSFFSCNNNWNQLHMLAIHSTVRWIKDSVMPEVRLWYS